jgi:hypothetical protein
MNTTFHVTVNSRGAARLTKGKPAMFAGEVTIKVTVKVPDSAFRNPFAETTIEIPEGFIMKPEIEAWLEPIEEEEDET